MREQQFTGCVRVLPPWPYMQETVKGMEKTVPETIGEWFLITKQSLIVCYHLVSACRFKRQISDKPQVTVLWKCIKLQYIAQNGKKTPCIWYWNQIRGCCDILLFILPAAVSRLHRNGSSALIPPAGRILSRPSPQSTHGWTRYAHCCKIYLVQMKSNIQCDLECDFLLYLRTLPFNLTV